MISRCDIITAFCLDFNGWVVGQLVIKLTKEGWGAWEAAAFAPEAAFLEDAKAVEGVTAVETQVPSAAVTHTLTVHHCSRTLLRSCNGGILSDRSMIRVLVM